MQITPDTLATLNNGFNAAFLQGFNAIGSQGNQYQQVCMEVSSSHRLENYGWMKDLPGVREWIGPRLINNLEATGYQIVNKDWEHTLGIKRPDIEDDILGVFTLAVQQQGDIVGRHPNELVFAQTLLKGFTTTGFDGQYFFDTDHIGYDVNGAETSWSNAGGGSGSPWFLLDLSRTFMRPLVFQMRRAPEFTPLVSPSDPNVFHMNEFLYGVYARYAAGFGFHQLAYGSKQTLDAAAYAAARTALGTQYRPDGSALAVRGTHLVVGPGNEAAARRILLAERDAAGATNIWQGTAEPLIVPQLG
ncbi:Mu-like prophage major head subunit gpT [Methylomagnum ishizawai]|uniref:Mu-like prophage major head subunit gpT n=1 Tax=Methylomagnum ishizawai TaxID=1760988 RepID=A0A1Y6CVM8_9GAMM|nr:Mu-like prophage major head subunit gpT family protein [Methylomagnum ishizawai]SMF94346.1 Mu-like prophage major head subunit gpT [Methylomagnum ishizawai]